MSNYLMVPVKPVQSDLVTELNQTIYVPIATKQTYGTIKIGDGLLVDNGVISFDTDNISIVSISLNGSPLNIDDNKNVNIVLSKNDVGLNEVDNTSDEDKPVSLAQQSALNLKLDKNQGSSNYGKVLYVTSTGDVGLRNVGSFTIKSDDELVSSDASVLNFGDEFYVTASNDTVDVVLSDEFKNSLGKIDSISLNGVPQTIDSNKNVDLEIPIDNKLDKSNANRDVMTNQSISISGDNVSLVNSYINLNTLTTKNQSNNFSLASDNQAGLMSIADYKSIRDLQARVGQLEQKATRLLYDEKLYPTAEEINTFVISLGYTIPFEGIAVVISGTNHIWHYYDGGTGWKDDGVDVVSQFTNDIAGIIKGAAIDGKIYAETDGTGSVYGWDTFKTSVTNNLSLKADKDGDNLSDADVNAWKTLLNVPSMEEIGDLTSLLFVNKQGSDFNNTMISTITNNGIISFSSIGNPYASSYYQDSSSIKIAFGDDSSSAGIEIALNDSNESSVDVSGTHFNFNGVQVATLSDISNPGTAVTINGEMQSTWEATSKVDYIAYGSTENIISSILNQGDAILLTSYDATDNNNIKATSFTITSYGAELFTANDSVQFAAVNEETILGTTVPIAELRLESTNTLAENELSGIKINATHSDSNNTPINSFIGFKNDGKLYAGDYTNPEQVAMMSDIGETITLYNTTGQNTDGAMTQKAVTDAIPTTLSDLTEDSTHRLVTDTEKATWNAKSDFSGSYNDLTNKPTIPTLTSQLTNDSNFVSDSAYVHTDNNYTTEEKNKLAGIEAGAEVNTVTSVAGKTGTVVLTATDVGALPDSTFVSTININGQPQTTLSFDSDPQTQINNIANNTTKIANIFGGASAGKNAIAIGGGAIGNGATAGNGFAGGFDAKAVNENGVVIDAIQLGTGTNTTEKSLQIYDDNIYNASTHTLTASTITAASNLNCDTDNVWFGGAKAFDSGSNANGYWVRFADGTQICIGNKNNLSSSSYTLPYPFIDTNYALAVAQSKGASGNVRRPGLTIVSNTQFRGDIDANIGNWWYIAIGRWK